MGEQERSPNFSDALVADLGASARRRSLATGEVLVAQGDVADEVFVVMSGRLEAVTRSERGDVVVGSIGAGQIVGEVTVIAGGHRTATLRAVEPCEVLVLERADFEAWLTEHPVAADAVTAEARARIDRSQVTTMVAELVGDGEPTIVQEIVDRVVWRHLAAGEVLFEQGDPSDAAYFVVAGRLRAIQRGADGSSQPIAEMGRGDVVGELGLLGHAPRSATVRAVRDSTLAALSAEAFEGLIAKSPAFMLYVARALLTRVRHTPRRSFRRASSLAVAVTAPIDSAPLVDGIVDAIARFGSVRRLSSGRVDELLNRPGIAQAPSDNAGVPRLAEFMHEADVGNDHLVLETDRELTAWTRRSLHQADRVVIVCSPHPTSDETALIGALVDEARDLQHATVMLAVAHPAHADRPRRTALLADRFEVDEVVHIRVGNAADIGRLGRLASGNGVGLVLSGGGARGFAHLGVHRALVEAGVPIDAVGGCSIGAPLGAAIAMGTPVDSLVGVVQRQFLRLLDYTIPMVSLVKGQRISASIDATIGSWDIEDFWLPFYCVSTNLTQSRLEIHRRGSASRAVRASVAIPGILPPVPHDGDLLVDGGVLNNLPFEVMRQDRRIDTVIAVDVSPARGPRATTDYGTSVSGFRALATSVRGGGFGYPSVAAVLLRSMLVGSVHHQRESLTPDAVDLLIGLDLRGVGLLDFKRVAEVAAQGYEASLATVTEWARTSGWSAAA